MFGEQSIDLRINNPEAEPDYRVRKTLAWIQDAFPEKQFRLYSREGSGGIIFIDNDNPEILYKIGIDGHSDNDYFENEAKMLQLCGSRDIAARLLFYAPAQLSEQLQSLKTALYAIYKHKAEDPRLSQIIIPLKNVQSQSPIIVMERLDIEEGWFNRASDEELEIEAERLGHELAKLQVTLGDVQPVFDRKSGKVKLIDLGGASLSREIISTKQSKDELLEIFAYEKRIYKQT